MSTRIQLGNLIKNIGWNSMWNRTITRTDMDQNLSEADIFIQLSVQNVLILKIKYQQEIHRPA